MNLICAVLNHNLLLEMVSIFVGTGSVLHCWQFLVFTFANALNFINRRFGSLFWLLGVAIGSIFHKKMGPYPQAWRSLLVLVGSCCAAIETRGTAIKIAAIISFISSLTSISLI